MVRVEVTSQGKTKVWDISDRAAEDQGVLVEETNELMVYLRLQDQRLDALGPIPTQVYEALVLVLDGESSRINLTLADSEDTDMEVSVFHVE